VDDYLAFGRMLLNKGKHGRQRLTQCLWDSPNPPGVYLDFWTSAYQAIDD
jgi:hypothetical protein